MSQSGSSSVPSRALASSPDAHSRQCSTSDGRRQVQGVVPISPFEYLQHQHIRTRPVQPSAMEHMPGIRGTNQASGHSDNYRDSPGTIWDENFDLMLASSEQEFSLPEHVFLVRPESCPYIIPPPVHVSGPQTISAQQPSSGHSKRIKFSNSKSVVPKLAFRGAEHALIQEAQSSTENPNADDEEDDESDPDPDEYGCPTQELKSLPSFGPTHNPQYRSEPFSPVLMPNSGLATPYPPFRYVSHGETMEPPPVPGLADLLPSHHTSPPFPYLHVALTDLNTNRALMPSPPHMGTQQDMNGPFPSQDPLHMTMSMPGSSQPHQVVEYPWMCQQDPSQIPGPFDSTLPMPAFGFPNQGAEYANSQARHPHDSRSLAPGGVHQAMPMAKPTSSASTPRRGPQTSETSSIPTKTYRVDPRPACRTCNTYHRKCNRGHPCNVCALRRRPCEYPGHGEKQTPRVRKPSTKSGSADLPAGTDTAS